MRGAHFPASYVNLLDGLFCLCFIVVQKVKCIIYEKRIVDFLLVIIELFSLALTAEALLSEICRNRRFLKGWVTLSATFR